MKTVPVLVAVALSFFAPLGLGETSLRDVGDIGKVIDSQGVTSLRPKIGTRWTGATASMPVKPGDWLRTDVRGANALQIAFADGSGDTITLGPGTLVEIVDLRTLRLVRGEMELGFHSKKRTRTVHSPDRETMDFSGDSVALRISKKDELIVLKNEPNWLKGFKGSVVRESMGELVAKVDGRNTPLTIGYHKVNVDIRDQIARTTIEESFVNHTDSRLEGVFYFPLPQDASISNFGMWINGELVEADVVEKQRAREIYETILREKRDPGLLEWTGGNLFKARVFPIFAHSEKRIKITYTQVLPYRNGSYRYSYALQSEMLRANPLRELAVNVRVHSAMPIKAISCTSHAARTSSTKNSAQLDFNAQEYTPQKDFEVEISVDRGASPVTVIPHQRGEDGYFLALITPPDEAGAWQRDLVADGAPIELIVLADTSGSMDETARENQDALIAALLGSLGEADQFQIATCDSEVNWWARPEDRELTREGQVSAAREFVAERSSLGWSDLDRAFDSVTQHFKKSNPPLNRHVIYIGDGVITTGAADPVAFANRLEQSFAKLKAATFHAVAPSSSFESGVLSSIASINGGSVRKIEGSDTPAVVANQLLAEISVPGLRDLEVEFNGLRTARVYPGRLPNLAPGRQHIILGRYLPEGQDKTGEIVVTGVRDGRKITFRSPVELRDAESGNSFIPRLWARMHLDELLAQGRTQEVRDEVIALSEEYHIMTPYTSFLVLESDADRERFKVKRRFLMRDGERFFADGRNQANYELLQQQMRLAGSWRLNLRRQSINELRSLGRITSLYTNLYASNGRPELRAWDGYGEVGDRDGRDYSYNTVRNWGKSSPDDLRRRAPMSPPVNQPFDDIDSSGSWEIEEESESIPMDRSPSASRAEAPTAEGASPLDPANGLWEVDDEMGQLNESLKKLSAKEDMRSRRQVFGPAARGNSKDMKYMLGSKGKEKREMAGGGFGNRGSYRSYHWADYVQDLQSLFPQFNTGATAPADRAPSDWPAEAVEIADSLLRVEKLRESGRGVELTVVRTQRDVRFDRLRSSVRTDALISGSAWSTAVDNSTGEVLVNWWMRTERGVFGRSFGLGRLRKPGKQEGDAVPSLLDDASFASIADSYRNYSAAIEKKDKKRVLLTVTYDNGERKNGRRYLIDTERNVVLERESFTDEKVTQTTLYYEFKKAGDVWWATQIKTTDAGGKITAEDTVDVREHGVRRFAGAFAKQLRGRDKVIFLNEPLPALDAAKQAGLDGKRTFNSELELLNHFAYSQQWERADEHFERLRKFAGEQPGFRWLEMRFERMKRRNEEVKQAVLAIAVEEGIDFPTAARLRNASVHVMAANEQHDLLALLKKIYATPPRHTAVEQQWDEAWKYSLQSIGRPDEALAYAKLIADKYPTDANSQKYYAQMLANRGDYAAGNAWLLNQIEVDHWTADERTGLRYDYVNQLENQHRVKEIRDYLDAWLTEEPEPNAAWPFQRLASAMIRLDEVEHAYEMMEGWLAKVIETDEEDLEPIDYLRLDAAKNVLIGHSRGVGRSVIEERFRPALAEIVRKFARSQGRAHYATQLMSDYRFHQTDEVRELRAEFAIQLAEDSGTMPLPDLQRLVGWIMNNNPAVEKETWRKIVDPMIARWSKLEATPQRDQWSGAITHILRNRFTYREQADFLRRQMREGEEAARGRYAYALFERLVTMEWSEAHEAEAFDLLYIIEPSHRVVEQLGDGEGDELLAFRSSALMRISDWVMNSGYTILYGKVEKKEDLSRTELAAIQREKRDEIRKRLTARLADELDREDLPEPLSHWINIERLYFDIANKRDPKEVAAECWEFLGKFDPLSDPTKRTWDEFMLISRYLDTLENLAARPKADLALVDRVLKLHRDGIEAQPETDAWKLRNYRLLVALDRPKELKAALRSWVRPGEADTQWRVSLGYLLAELNDIGSAITEFEAVEKADELGPREYRVLADWYLVRDAKEKRREALLGYYDVLSDNQISQLINKRTDRVRRGFENGAPEDLDPEVPIMFTVLLRKSPHPQNYLYQLSSLYQYTKDFRLLECVPEGIIGHTSMQIYPYLQQMATVHNHIRDEATADMIFAHLEKVRARAKTATDQRGLDLLEMLVRRKASEVLNQPGQHLPMALAAMKRAFDGDWADGERLQMATFLHTLGAITQEPLAAEQRREMSVLHRDEKADADRMNIGHLRGQLLWQYKRHTEALTVLEVVLRDIEDVHGGTMPSSAQNVLSTYLGYLIQQKQYARAEKEIFHVLGQEKIVASLRDWTFNRKFQLYNEALYGKGTVSIGSGFELYKNAERMIIAALPELTHQMRYSIVQTLTSIYGTAHSREVGDAAADVLTFAYGAFDELVPFETQHYQNLVKNVASTIQGLNNYWDGLAFLIDRYEKEPQSFLATNTGGWRSYGSTMGSYRRHLKKPLGKLEPRLLKIVLGELHRELTRSQRVYTGIFWYNSSNFWSEKKEDFARVAEEALEESLDSPQTVVYIAQYLHGGLRLYDRAIEVLIAVYDREELDESGWSLLVQYLENAGRWKEVIHYLVPLVAHRPDYINYRIRLMKGYFHNGQKKKLVATLDEIDARWHEKKWWNENTLANVAPACYQTGLWQRAVDYYDELIALHQRAQPNRGIGNGTLSGYYGTLSMCHEKLGDTVAAVEAASGAIVSWGSGHTNRGKALAALTKVLKNSKDLPGYVKFLEEQVEETGLENPIVRRSLGGVFIQKGDHDNAIHHLALAIENQPDDASTHRMLVRAYDDKKDPEGAISCLLESVKLSRRNIELFRDLGDRYEKLGRDAEAERARTSIIEALPNESEGHALLAEIRQDQDRWKDAAAHWQQVAIIRELEPTGLQRLGHAQVMLGQRAEAKESFEKLLAKDWPSRFGNVHKIARQRLASLEKTSG